MFSACGVVTVLCPWLAAGGNASHYINAAQISKSQSHYLLLATVTLAKNTITFFRGVNVLGDALIAEVVIWEKRVAMSTRVVVPFIQMQKI